MKAFRTPDGQIEMQEFPVGAQLLTVDDMDGPFGRVALAVNVLLPDGRIVAVPVRPAPVPAAPRPADQLQ